jgi:Rieske Fe-S protein
VARQYADWLTRGEVRSAAEIAPESGAIMRRGLHKIAVYRDASGVVTERSAACPHLGCIVHWNAAGKTWDCPCHGSRFDPHGHVLNGPANRDLAPIGVSQKRRAA